MKIQEIRIKNYRSIKDQTISCSSYNVFVGPNGSGKSSILHAINLFFGEQQSFSDDDFTDRDTSAPIEVSLTFVSLSKEAKEEFKHYVRHGKMTVVAEVTRSSEGKYTFTRKGERLVNPDFTRFFRTPKSPVAERRKIYAELKNSYPNLENQTSNDGMENALRDYEENMPADQKEIFRSTDEFFGVSKGTNRINRLLTWVYVPAVKEAASESEEARNTHLGRLIQHTVRSSMNYEEELEGITNEARSRYEQLLSNQQQHLANLEKRLSMRLQSSVTSTAGIELRWRSDDKSVIVSEPSAAVQLEDKGFKGNVQNFGHGLQRAFLLVILQELLREDSGNSPTLILGCEEPELYQHPPQARNLASVLKDLGKDDGQIFLTTHSPYFVDIESLDGLKKIVKSDGHSSIHIGDLSKLTDTYNACFEDAERNIDAVRAKLCIQLQPRANELFFSEFVVLVEGISDRSYLETYMTLSGKMSEFQKLGGNIIEAGGKGLLILLLLLARQFDIPRYVIFDCDGNEHRDAARNKHKKDNLTAFKLTGQDCSSPFPKETIVNDVITAWRDDIEEIIDADFGPEKEQAIEHGQRAAGRLKDCRKNPFFISASLSYAWQKSCRFDTLSKVVGKIFEAANR